VHLILILLHVKLIVNLLGRLQISNRTFQFPCLISVKFGIRNLNVTLFSICDCHENRLKEGRAFLKALVKLHLPLYCESAYFKITGSLGKICVLPVRYALCHL
jgi:hypothetical protein